ncbi:hypothetical protein AOQ84DRAFT_28057 [Glonium stellatum]|uniref:Uncharacterized protein n=1 Tax=Glonium stellatum TaxID=574774 RepID=A0A8E2F397_9PEZI|nr:hypothetical protein AOQ84DRAFT_28057 [Glonium stellatum]
MSLRGRHPFETRPPPAKASHAESTFPASSQENPRCVLVTFSFRKATSSSGGSILPRLLLVACRSLLTVGPLLLTAGFESAIAILLPPDDNETTATASP